MNRTTISSLTLAVAALVAGNAMAADKTSSDVAAEFQQAQSSGQIAYTGSSSELHGKTLAQIYGSSSNVAPAAGKTRAEVVAELEQAQRAGQIAFVGSNGELRGQTLAQIYGNADASGAKVAGKTREQVVAELEQAQRDGDITVKFGGAYAKARDIDTTYFN